MILQKQVNKTHYQFSHYITKLRWASVWHQLDEVQRLKPESVLEIGPGPGLFKKVSSVFDITVETLDIDPDLEPDHVASAMAMPFDDSSFDVVCAFQMLEHLPYEESLKVCREMARVCRKHVVISLPNVTPVWRYLVHIPKFGPVDFFIPNIFSPPVRHQFDGEHHWELGKLGFSVNKLLRDLSLVMTLVKHYRVRENPYHHFFVFKKS